MVCIWVDVKTEWKIKQICVFEKKKKASKAKKQDPLSISETEQSWNPGSGYPECHSASVSVFGFGV